MLHFLITAISLASLMLLPYTVSARRDDVLDYGSQKGQENVQSSGFEKRQKVLNLPPVKATMVLSYVCNGEPIVKKGFTASISVVKDQFVFVAGQNVDGLEGAVTHNNSPYHSGHARWHHTYCAPPARGSRCVYTYSGTYVTSATKKIWVGSSTAGEPGVLPPQVTKTCESMANKPSTYCPPVSTTAEVCQVGGAQVIIS